VDVGGRDMPLVDSFQDGFDGTRDEVGVVAAAVVGEAEEVAARIDGHAEGLGKAILPGDGPHGEVVGDNHPGETKVVAQQFANDKGGEGGGQVVAKGAVDNMGHHDHVDVALADEVAVGLEFGLLPSVGDIDKTRMGVAGGTAMAGEVFEAADDVLFVEFVEPDGGTAGDGGGVGGEAAPEFADDGAGGIDVDIDAGRKIEVDAGLGECAGHDGGCVGHAVVAIAGRGLGREGRGEAVAGAQTHHVAPFLVDGDEEVAATIFAQGGTEVAQLLGRLDVAVACAGGSVVFEQDDAADVVLLEVADDVVVLVDGGATEAYEEYLSDVLFELFDRVDGWGLLGLGGAGLATGGGDEDEQEGGDDGLFHEGGCGV